MRVFFLGVTIVRSATQELWLLSQEYYMYENARMPAHKKREITNVSLQDFVGPVWCSSERGHSPNTWAMKKKILDR